MMVFVARQQRDRREWHWIDNFSTRAVGRTAPTTATNLVGWIRTAIYYPGETLSMRRVHARFPLKEDKWERGPLLRSFLHRLENRALRWSLRTWREERSLSFGVGGRWWLQRDVLSELQDSVWRERCNSGKSRNGKENQSNMLLWWIFLPPVFRLVHCRPSAPRWLVTVGVRVNEVRGAGSDLSDKVFHKVLGVSSTSRAVARCWTWWLFHVGSCGPQMTHVKFVVVWNKESWSRKQRQWFGRFPHVEEIIVAEWDRIPWYIFWKTWSSWVGKNVRAKAFQFFGCCFHTGSLSFHAFFNQRRFAEKTDSVVPEAAHSKNFNSRFGHG